jgi:hypothetical protein
MVMVSFNTLIFPNDVNNAKNTQSHTSNIINNKPLLLFDGLGFFYCCYIWLFPSPEPGFLGIGYTVLSSPPSLIVFWQE